MVSNKKSHKFTTATHIRAGSNHDIAVPISIGTAAHINSFSAAAAAAVVDAQVF